MPTDERFHQSTGYRIATVALGLLFVGVAVLILVLPGAPTDMKEWAAAGGLGGLGLDTLISVVRGKRALLSRIGPLP